MTEHSSEQTAQSAPELISIGIDKRVATVTLGNGRAHPLSLALIRTLHSAITELHRDADVGAIIIEGPGHIFCAGHDLKEIKQHRSDADHGLVYLRELFAACAELMLAISHCAKPTIAMVDGIATAAGLQLVCACDLAFASTRASVSLPGVNNQGFCTTPAVAVSRTVARKHLMELLLSGETFDVAWAERVGIFNRVFSSEELAGETRLFATTLAGRNIGPISAGKQTTLAHLDMPLSEAYAVATETMIGHFMDPKRIEEEMASQF